MKSRVRSNAYLNFGNYFRTLFRNQNRVFKMRGEGAVFCSIGVAVGVKLYVGRAEGNNRFKRENHSDNQFFSLAPRSEIRDKRTLVHPSPHAVSSKLIDDGEPCARDR